MPLPMKKYFRLLVQYLRPQWPRVLLLFTLMGSSIGLHLWNPQNLRRFIDGVISRKNTDGLLGLALLYMVVALVNHILHTAGKYSGESVGWTATTRLRSDLIRHCLKLDMSFHKTQNSGQLIERIDSDVSLLTNFFSQFIVGVVSNVILLIGILLMLFREDWRIGLVMSCFSLVALAVLMRIRRLGVPRWAESRQTAAEFYGFLGERLGGLEDIRSSGATNYVMHRFFERLRHWLPINDRAKLAYYYLWMGSLVVFGFGTVLALGSGAYLYLRGIFSLGTVYLVFHYTVLLERPIEQIRRQMQDLQSAGAAIDRIDGLLARQTVLPEGTVPDLPAGSLRVEFREVSFAYEDGENVLHGLGFNLVPGKILGLLGRTGSGKTTVARLLMRLYDPSGGAILLNGTNAADFTLKALRRRVGLVTQDVQLFAASIRDNLTFFNPTVDDAAIWQALDEIGIADWCRSFPNGLDTLIGPGGFGLSAGESQVLALTRLFLSNPGLVVLDEASSRLDPATEQMVERAFARVLAGRTGIIIAHRLSTVMKADEILILDSGRILEHGDRIRLMNNPDSRFHALLKTGLEDLLA